MTDEQKRKYSEDFKQNHTIEELDADGDIDVVNDDGGGGAAKRKPREGGKKRKLVAVPIHPPQHMTSMEARCIAVSPFMLGHPPIVPLAKASVAASWHRREPCVRSSPSAPGSAGSISCS